MFWVRVVKKYFFLKSIKYYLYFQEQYIIVSMYDVNVTNVCSSTCVQNYNCLMHKRHLFL